MTFDSRAHRAAQDIHRAVEVMEMSSTKTPTPVQRFDEYRDRKTRNQRIAAVIVGIVVPLLLVVGLVRLIGSGNDRGPALTTPSPTLQVDPKAEGAATGFARAFGDFDTDRTLGYLADDADISGVAGVTRQTLPKLFAMFEAVGFRQLLGDCTVTGVSSVGTFVRCPFDFHDIRSDRIGRGPFHGSHFLLTIRDGRIARASMTWQIEEFSPQMWEPFAQWVSTTHPNDVDVMYQPGQSDWLLTNESIRLWELRSKEYVAAVQQGTA